MNIGIVGGRNFKDYEFMKAKFLETVDVNSVECIISGGARGADSLSEKLAKEFELDIKIFYPNKMYGFPAALFIRNSHIVEQSDILLAFPDKNSSGTWDTVKKMRRTNKECYVFFNY